MLVKYSVFHYFSSITDLLYMLFIGDAVFLPGASSVHLNAAHTHSAWPLLVLRGSERRFRGLYVYIC